MGDVILAQPLASSIMTMFLTAIVVTIVVFMSLGSYARKETVPGFLTPDKGLVTVHAPRAATVAELYVGEGEIVARGAPLLTLLGDRISDEGVAIDAEMLAAIGSQIDELRVRERLEVRRRTAEAERLSAELRGLRSEQEAIDEQIRAQRLLLDSLQQDYRRVHEIRQQGFASSGDVLPREEKLLTSRQSLAGLVQKRAANSTRLEQLVLALERLPLEHEHRLSELASARAGLVLESMELEGRTSITITAPVAGKASALRAIEGASVDTSLPLLAIIPEGGRLEAQLYVPSRAIGFVAVGQEVRLLYDAFDYRRFGVHSGRVSEVSSAVFLPRETRSGIHLAEPAYRVTVAIDAQAVAAYGRELPLQPGMLLRADIVLERRSLVDLLLDPLLSLRGRT